MTTESSNNDVSWFVLNHLGGTFQNLAQKSIDRFNQSRQCSLELFAPTYLIREERGGEIRFRNASLTFHYVFVRGTLEEVKQLCAQPSNRFSLLINRSSEERYAVIDDRRMMQFKNIAKAYKNALPCFQIDEIDLEEGDLVEVVSGTFTGLVGRFIPKAKSKSGNIVLNIYEKLMTITSDIESTEVRVLEFAKDSTRANEQIDAFTPHLLSALRLFSKNEVLSKPLISKLSVFCGRMEMVNIPQKKLNAKLQALLYAAFHILGKIEEADSHLAGYEQVKDSITNEWTIALITLILGVITDNTDLLEKKFSVIKSIEAGSKMRRLIRDEYTYYLTQKNN